MTKKKEAHAPDEILTDDLSPVDPETIDQETVEQEMLINREADPDLPKQSDEPSPLAPPVESDLPKEPAFTPQSCPNCGSSGEGIVRVTAAGQFTCVRCRHVWTPREEQAPFRRYRRTGT